MVIDKIYNENCLDTMKRMISDNQKVDIILTSPPYHHDLKFLNGEYVIIAVYTEYPEQKLEHDVMRLPISTSQETYPQDFSMC